VSCDCTLTNPADNRGDVLALAGCPASAATTLLPANLPLFEKLGTRVKAVE